MENYNNSMINTDDYSLSFSEEVNDEFASKVQAVFPDATAHELKAYSANVLIGNIPAKKLNECVGESFLLCGFYAKNVKFKDKRIGKYTLMFGRCVNNKPCSYATTSDKIYDALVKIIAVYGDATAWKQGITVKIRMNNIDNDSKAYSLEVI